MTPDDQPATPAGLRPETAVICACRPSRAGSEPLNIPVVLASNFHASTTAAPGIEEGSRSYARTDATPTWEALQTAVGQVEGGHAVAFSSSMAAVAVAAVLGLVPASGRIVAPTNRRSAKPLPILKSPRHVLPSAYAGRSQRRPSAHR